MQNESSPNFLNFCPGFRPEFCCEFSPNFWGSFRASFRGKWRPEKIHQKSPLFSILPTAGKGPFLTKTAKMTNLHSAPTFWAFWIPNTYCKTRNTKTNRRCFTPLAAVTIVQVLSRRQACFAGGPDPGRVGASQPPSTRGQALQVSLALDNSVAYSSTENTKFPGKNDNGRVFIQSWR